MKNLKNLRRNKKGFTLVEVIVVLVILAILIAIAVPSVMKYIDEANDAKYLAEARAVYVAAEGEITKDYGDDKNINGSIYDSTKKETLLSEISATVGFEVSNVTTDPVASGAVNPNDIKTYTVTFDSPSSTNTRVTVEIKKNGSSKITSTGTIPTNPEPNPAP